MKIQSFSTFLRRLTEDYKTTKVKFLTQLEKDQTERDIDKSIELFRKNQNHFSGDEKNIDWWGKQGWVKFKAFMDVHAIEQDKNFITLRADEDWLIVVPLNHQASCYHGSGTDWCTTKPSKNYFAQYFFDTRGLKSKNGEPVQCVLIYCIKSPKESNPDKWAMVPYFTPDYRLPEIEDELEGSISPIEFFDSRDKKLSQEEFETETNLRVNDILVLARKHKDTIEQKREDNKKLDAKYLLNVLQKEKQLPPMLDLLLQNTLTRQKQYVNIKSYTHLTGHRIPKFEATFSLKKYMSEPDTVRSPRLFVDFITTYMNNVKLQKWPRIEDELIDACKKNNNLKDRSEYVFAPIQYMINIHRTTRWPEWEELILTKFKKLSDFSDVYDRPLFGKYIEQAKMTSWPEAEKKILDEKDIESALIYVKTTKKKSWPEFEKVMADPQSNVSLRKAIEFISETGGERIKAIETRIIQDKNSRRWNIINYVETVNMGRWKEAEEIILRDVENNTTGTDRHLFDNNRPIDDAVSYMEATDSFSRGTDWPELEKAIISSVERGHKIDIEGAARYWLKHGSVNETQWKALMDAIVKSNNAAVALDYIEHMHVRKWPEGVEVIKNGPEEIQRSYNYKFHS